MSRTYCGVSFSTVTRTTRPKRRRRTPCSITLEQVVGFELLDGHLGVARDPEGVGVDDLHAGEELVEVGGDELLEPHEVALAARRSVGGRPCRGHRDQARQRARHLDAGEELLAVRVAQQHGEVEAQVGDVGERPAGVEGERCEHREDVGR